ncbi:MAG: response regulator [Coleofasciculus sp. G1-WW12-02]|uniref:response regulator n=1 Tax=Coleofasciculus sp. G1-WW12-02 TaxID=3068483 RepID=UPI0032FFC5F2
MNNANILIVDDEKNIRLTIAQSLDPLGYQVGTADNGEDALLQLQSQEYDLILLDLKMPGMNGLEVLRRAIEIHPDIKVIIISAHGTIEDAVEAMKLGAVDFLQKPFTPKELRDLVFQVLEIESSKTNESSSYKKEINIAKKWRRKRQFNKAIVHVKQAIGLDPSLPDAFNMLGELQEIEGELLEALKNYRVALDLDPTYKPAQANLKRATQSPKSRPPLS